MKNDPDSSWFDRHATLMLVILLAGAALLLWLVFFRKRGGLPAALPAQPMPRILVSQWSPLP